MLRISNALNMVSNSNLSLVVLSVFIAIAPALSRKKLLLLHSFYSDPLLFTHFFQSSSMNAFKHIPFPLFPAQFAFDSPFIQVSAVATWKAKKIPDDIPSEATDGIPQWVHFQ